MAYNEDNYKMYQEGEERWLRLAPPGIRRAWARKNARERVNTERERGIFRKQQKSKPTKRDNGG